jgi:hypothetical protein
LAGVPWVNLAGVGKVRLYYAGSDFPGEINT